jgi:hypothetical protein
MTEDLKDVLRSLLGRQKGGSASGLGGSLDALKAGVKYRASMV